jgi:hypothetical protein
MEWLNQVSVETNWYDKVTELQKTVISLQSAPKPHSMDQLEIQEEEITKRKIQ